MNTAALIAGGCIVAAWIAGIILGPGGVIGVIASVLCFMMIYTITRDFIL